MTDSFILHVAISLLPLLACGASAQEPSTAGVSGVAEKVAPDSGRAGIVSGAPARQPILFKGGTLFRGARISLDGENYDPVFEGESLDYALAPLPSAARDYRSARSTHHAASMLAIVGEALIGAALGWGLVVEHEWFDEYTYMAAGGVAFATGGVLLDASAERRVRNAVNDFNSWSAPRASLHRHAAGGALVARVELRF